MRRSRLRYLALIAAACLLSGCAADVVMVNPRTGETARCTWQMPFRGLSGTVIVAARSERRLTTNGAVVPETAMCCVIPANKTESL